MLRSVAAGARAGARARGAAHALLRSLPPARAAELRCCSRTFFGRSGGSGNGGDDGKGDDNEGSEQVRVFARMPRTRAR